MLSAFVNRLPGPVRKQIEHRINLLRVAENTGWLIANNVVRLVIAMVVGIWVARYLGAEQYGLYSYAVSLNTLLRLIIPIGFTSLMVRDLARTYDQRNVILGSAFFVQLLVSVGVMLVAIGIAFYTQQSDATSAQLTRILAVTLLLMPFEVLTPWFQSQLQSVKTLIANSTSLLLMAAARVWLVNVEASLEAFVYLVIAERLVNIGTMLYLYQKSGQSIWQWKFDARYAWRTAWEGMPLFWSSLARTAYARSTEVMLKGLSGASAVGYYAAANRIAELYLIVPTAIVSSATPVISKSKTENRGLYLRQMTHLFRVTGAIGILSTIAVGLIAHWLMPFIYGEEFAGAGAVLAISLWSAVPTSFNMITGLWVINEGLAPIAFQKIVVLATMVVALNWLLIPFYGAPGAAMSSLIASILVHIVWDFVDPRLRNFGYLKLHALMPWWFSLKDL